MKTLSASDYEEGDQICLLRCPSEGPYLYFQVRTEEDSDNRYFTLYDINDGGFDRQYTLSEDDVVDCVAAHISTLNPNRVPQDHIKINFSEAITQEYFLTLACSECGCVEIAWKGSHYDPEEDHLCDDCEQWAGVTE